MAKKSRKPKSPVDKPEVEPDNAIDDEARPGETLEEWNERLNREEGYGEEPQTHDKWERRERHDPHMGTN